MDKIEQLYNFYREKGLLSEAITLDMFRQADDLKQQKLYDLGRSKGLFQKTELSTFQTAWGDLKKKDVPDMASTSGAGSSERQEAVETTPVDSTQTPFTPIPFGGGDQPEQTVSETIQESAAPQEDIVEETTLEAAAKPLADKTFEDFELVETEPRSVEEIETDVISGLGLNKQEYDEWKVNNVRPESKTYKFLKESMLGEEGLRFEREETVNTRIAQFLGSKLYNNLSSLDPVQDKELIQQLRQENEATRQQIIKLLPQYEKEIVLDDRKERQRLLDNLNSNWQLPATMWEAGKSVANNIQKYSMGLAAAIPQKLDAFFNAGGMDKKGLWAGLTEAMLDSSQAWDLDLGETKRPVFLEGKKVIHRGKSYLVDGGIIYDEETHIRVDDLIDKDIAKEVFAKADKVKDTETYFDGGSGLVGLSGQLANLYALIRTGKALNIGPKLGMGVASYGSTVAQNIDDVRQDLMAQGMSEQEATELALAFGTLNSTFDGVFSALAGGNQKLLPPSAAEAVKQQLLDLAKNYGSKYGRQAFLKKGRELLIENAKELGVEELPVLLAERLSNDALNFVAGREARGGISTLSAVDVYDTAFLTLGSTTALGAPRLLSGNNRNNTIRTLAQSNRDFSTVADGLIKDGLMTREEANIVIGEIDNFRAAERKTAGAIKGTENILDAAELIEEKDNLIRQRENMDPSLRGPIDKKIQGIDDQLKALQERDAQEVADELGKTITQEVTEQEVRDALKAEGIENPTMEQMVQKSEELMAPKEVEQEKLVSREEALQSLKEENEARSRTGLPIIRESEENIKKQQQKLQQDAIQEQEARDISDAQPTEAVQEVETEVRQPVVEEESKTIEIARQERLASKPKVYGNTHTSKDLPYGEAVIDDITNPDEKGVQTAKYVNPETGDLDVIISSTGDSNNFVGFTRVYENGKPTNRFTGKMESTGDAFKNMITAAESSLPPGAEVIETTSISLGGINAYKKSQILTPKVDSNGNVVTNPTKYSNATKESVAEKGQAAYNPFVSSDQAEIDAEVAKIKAANPDVQVRVENVETKGPKAPPLPPGVKPKPQKKNIIIDLPVYEKRATPEAATQISPEAPQEIEYTLPKKKPLSDFEIVNNRGGKAGLEIDNEGNGRYYVVNKVTGRLVPAKNKTEAQDRLRKLDWDYGEGDLVPFEPEPGPIKKEKPVVERKPIAQSQRVPSPKTGKPSNSQINIAEDGTLVSVTNVNTGKDVSRKTQQIAEQSFLTTGIDVNKETRIDENPDINPEQYVDEVIENGNNIKEIAEAISIAEQQTEAETVENPMLSELEGRKFTPESWTKMTGLPPKEMKRGFSRTWMSKDGESIEDLENMEEAIEFIKQYPTASDLNELKAGDMGAKNQVTRLKEKFEALTGVKATAANLKVVQDIDPLRPPLEAITPQVEAQEQMKAQDEQARKERESEEAFEKSQQERRDMMSDDAKNLQSEMQGKSERPTIDEIYDQAYKNQVSQQDAQQIARDLGYTMEEIRENRMKAEKLYVPVKTKLGKLIPGVDKVLDNLNRTQKYLRSARRYLPKGVFIAKERKNAEIDTEIQIAERIAKKFNKAMKGQPQEVYDSVNDFLSGREFGDVPTDILDIAVEMRAHLDRLSQMLIDTGAVKGESVENIKNNIGAYVNRSYKVFDDPTWAENVPEQIINEAREYLRKGYYSDSKRMESAQRQARESGLSVDEWIDKKVDLEIQDLIDPIQAEKFINASATEGSKNRSSLKQRKNIPPEIRALMGEYGDPAFNYANSVAKTTQMVENQKFLNTLKDIGLGIFLFNENDVNRPKGYVKIAAEGNKNLEPVDGLYAPKEVVEQLKEKGLFTANEKKFLDLVKGYAQAVGAVKKAKTIYSVATHMKNVFGNMFIMAQNGYVNPKEFNQAVRLLSKDLAGKSDAEANKTLDHYKRLGIINQSVQLNEIKEMLSGKESFDVKVQQRTDKRSDSRLKKFKDFITGKAKTTDRFLQDLYQSEDDLFKIAVYEKEKQSYADAMFGKTYDKLTDNERRQVDDKVSEIVKNILPNYSRLGGLARILRTIPLAGTFISFQLEAYRTATNTGKLAYDEIKSDNPKIKAKGIQRMATLIAFQSAKLALYKALGTFRLPSEDEEEEEEKGIIDYFTRGKGRVGDVTPFLPPYRKNSDLYIFDVGDGKFSYIDLSSSDPYGQIFKTFNALARGGSIEGAKELLSPLDADILAKTISNIVSGVDEYGRPLGGPDKTDAQTFLNYLNTIYKTFEPGTATSIRKSVKAFDRESLRGLRNETIGQFTGYKPYEVDVSKQLSFKLKDYSEDLGIIKKIKSRAKYAAIDTKDFSQIEKAWGQVIEKSRPIYKDIHKDVVTAMKLGVPLEKIAGLLKNQGFSKIDKAFILFYPELEKQKFQ